MHNGFISVAKNLFPKAHICIDMFHVVRLINYSIETIRRRLQHDMTDQQDDMKYRLLKNSARLLVTNRVKGNPLNASQQAKLQAIFEFFPDLSEAYDLLQNFHQMKALTVFALQRASLTDWLNTADYSAVPEIQDLAHSIRHWRAYIQNSWQYHRSNGTCEGLNNKIKVLKRTSFGLHCFDTFRKRTLLTCGYIHSANEPFTIFSEKRNGPGIKL